MSLAGRIWARFVVFHAVHIRGGLFKQELQNLFLFWGGRQIHSQGVIVERRGERVPERQPSGVHFGLHAHLDRLLIGLHDDAEPSVERTCIEQARAEDRAFGRGPARGSGSAKHARSPTHR